MVFWMAPEDPGTGVWVPLSRRRHVTFSSWNCVCMYPASVPGESAAEVFGDAVLSDCDLGVAHHVVHTSLVSLWEGVCRLQRACFQRLLVLVVSTSVDPGATMIDAVKFMWQD